MVPTTARNISSITVEDLFLHQLIYFTLQTKRTPAVNLVNFSTSTVPKYIVQVPEVLLLDEVGPGVEEGVGEHAGHHGEPPEPGRHVAPHLQDTRG